MDVLGFNVVGWFVGFTEVSTSAFYYVCPSTTTTYTLRLAPPVCGVAFSSATVTVTNHTVTLGSVPLIACGSATDCVPINLNLSGYTAGETVTVNWGFPYAPTVYTATGTGDVVASPCLTAGTYNITLTDENGCQQTISVTICYQECCHVDISAFTKVDATDPAVIAQLSSGGSVNWSGNIFVTGGELDVINNTTLNITNANVVFGDVNSYIYTNNGGYLYAEQSIFQPCDLHSTWPGLKFDWYYNGGQIDNCTIINGVYGLWCI